jgi:hypothetical protein
MSQPAASPQADPSRPAPARFGSSRAQEGVADLTRTLAEAESSRLLNLSQIHQRWGQDEAHAERPLFENKVLNRAIIMKYAPRPGELVEQAERRIKSTKILFPLDRNDLSLGSFSGLVGQKDFSRIMARHLNGSGRLSERDEKVLSLIDQLPTLDPFLLYALLKSNGLDVAQVYFRLSEADRQAIQEEMAQAFTPLMRLCFPEGGDRNDGVKSFIDKLLNFEESAEIDSLRGAFKLSPEPFSGAMFAWRGLIYYKWKTASLNTALTVATGKLSALKISETDNADGEGAAERSRAKILKIAATASARVQEMNARYDAAFADFVERREADGFRQFLISAPDLFLICGQSMAIIEHIINFIDVRPPASGPREPGAPAQSLAETFNRLERELGVDYRAKVITWS